MTIPVHMRVAAKPSSGPLIPSENNDAAIAEDLLLAFECLPVGDQAVWAVKRTWDLYETAMATQAENRRSSYEPKKKQPQYKPFTGGEMVRRRLLLDSIRRIQIENEGFSRKTDPLYDIQTLSLEINLVNLHHNAFWAAVGMTRVLGKYSATETINIYEHLMAGRSGVVKKDNSAVCRIESIISKVLRERFLDRIKLRAGSQKRLEKVEPTAAQIEALRYWLLRFFPTAPDPTLGFRPKNPPGSAYEGRTHMKTVESLLDMELFNAAADDLGIPQLEGALGIPLIATDLNNDPDNRPPGQQKNSDALAEKVERVKQGLVQARRKRTQMRPHSIAICVDDVYQGTLDGRQDECAIRIEETARIITFVAQDGNGQNLVLTAHVLDHDTVPEQTWEFFVRGFGKIVCDLRYRDDGEADASFLLTEKVSLWGRLTEAANMPVALLSVMKGGEEKCAVGQKLVTSSFTEQTDGNLVLYERDGRKLACPMVSDQMPWKPLTGGKNSSKRRIVIITAATGAPIGGLEVTANLLSDELSLTAGERPGLEELRLGVEGQTWSFVTAEVLQPRTSNAFWRNEAFRYVIFGKPGDGKTSFILSILDRLRLQLANAIENIPARIFSTAKFSGYRVNGMLDPWTGKSRHERLKIEGFDYLPFKFSSAEDQGFINCFVPIFDEHCRLRRLISAEEKAAGRAWTVWVHSVVIQCVQLLPDMAETSTKKLLHCRPLMLEASEADWLNSQPRNSPWLYQHIRRLAGHFKEPDETAGLFSSNLPDELNDFWEVITKELVFACGTELRCYHQAVRMDSHGASGFEESWKEHCEHLPWGPSAKVLFGVPETIDLEKKVAFPQQLSIQFAAEMFNSNRKTALPRMKSVKALPIKPLPGWEEEAGDNVYPGRVPSLFPSTRLEDYGARLSGTVHCLFR